MKRGEDKCVPAVATAVPRAKTVKNFILNLMPYAKYDKMVEKGNPEVQLLKE